MIQSKRRFLVENPFRPAPLSLNSSSRKFGWGLLIVAATQLLIACGGGGGGSSSGGVSGPTGALKVSLVDEFAAPVAGASVTVISLSSQARGQTDATGLASFDSIAAGTAIVEVKAVGFVDAEDRVSVGENAEASLDLSLERDTEPAAGLFSAQLTQALETTDGQTLTFSIEVLVVDDNAEVATAIETLTAANFRLYPCENNDPNIVECLRGGPGQADVGYFVVSPTPGNFELVAGSAANSYAATLMIDQSESTKQSDPADARLFATKVFLDNLGPNDYASVSAFAETLDASVPALIPDEPVTRLSGFIQSDSAETVYGALDELASQEGGDTPLFLALDQEIEYTAANAPTNPGQRRAVVLFTDGEDSANCLLPSTPTCSVEQSIQLSIDRDVDIFTVGLGADIDIDVLRRLAEGGRGFYLFAENAQQLFPLYRSLGELLSRTLSTYRMEWTIQATQAATYMDGQTLLGTLEVNTGQNIINLPVRLFLENTSTTP